MLVLIANELARMDGTQIIRIVRIDADKENPVNPGYPENLRSFVFVAKGDSILLRNCKFRRAND